MHQWNDLGSKPENTFAQTHIKTREWLVPTKSIRQHECLMLNVHICGATALISLFSELFAVDIIPFISFLVYPFIDFLETKGFAELSCIKIHVHWGIWPKAIALNGPVISSPKKLNICFICM